ncbi:kyphoscoliosis peptidase-like [Haliotis cracherodii]|uniref:kyphoscoliosis peptidase-like n=1 Tax=Haliotis cracherodii TaxID=6455 RepID=UPI0039E762AD
MGSNSSIASSRGDTLETVQSISGHDADPPIKPAKKRRSEAVPPVSDFKYIDQHALAAPTDVTSSVSSLAQYLVKPALTDMEKVRAFYMWITHNISYDAAGFQRDYIGPQDAESVLKMATGVCEGFATLFKELCREVNIPCKKISGFAKSFGHHPEHKYTADEDTDHAWNIVFVNGDWWPIEVTWGTGPIDKNYVFLRQYEEIHFLMDPNLFAIKHFPFMKNSLSESAMYQLLRKPISLEEFSKAAVPYNRGIEWGFESTTHRHQVVDVEMSCEITARCTRTTVQRMMCGLVEENTGKDCCNYVLIRKKDDGGFTVKVTPPRTGNYTLKILGQKDSNCESFHPLTSYFLRCTSCAESVKPYPKHQGLWGVQSNASAYGFQSDINKTDVVIAKNGAAELIFNARPESDFTVLLKDADDTKDLYKFIMAYRKNGQVHIKCRLPKAGYYSLRLFARNLTTRAPERKHIGSILIQSADAHPDDRPYPKQPGPWGMRTKALQYGFTKDALSNSIFFAEKGEVEIKLPTDRKIDVSLEIVAAEKTNEDTNISVSETDSSVNIRAQLQSQGFYGIKLFAPNSHKEGPERVCLGAFLVDYRKNDKPFL